MIYHTKNSRYEIAPDGKQFRRLIGDGLPEGIWSPCHAASGELGASLVITLPYGQSLVTSPIKGIAFDDEAPTRRRLGPPPGVL